MQKNYYAIMLLMSITIVSCAMDKKVNYIVYQKLNHGVPVTKINLFLAHEDSDEPGKLIKTIYLNENQTKVFVSLVEEAKVTKGWRAWNAARL